MILLYYDKNILQIFWIFRKENLYKKHITNMFIFYPKPKNNKHNITQI